MMQPDHAYGTRTAHMIWCKQRALEYLPDDPGGALKSMLSDLGKHPETADHIGIMLTMGLMLIGKLDTAPEVRKHIEGFN